MSIFKCVLWEALWGPLKCVRELRGIDRIESWERSATTQEMEKFWPAKQAFSLLHGADLGDGKVRVYWFGILTGESSSSLPRLCGLVSKWRIVSPRVFFLGGGGGNMGEERKMAHAFPFYVPTLWGRVWVYKAPTKNNQLCWLLKIKNKPLLCKLVSFKASKVTLPKQ